MPASRTAKHTQYTHFLPLQAPDADTHSSQICYAAAQHVVLLDGPPGQQHILQPACAQAVAILAASADREIVAAVGAGSPGLLTAWHVGTRACLGSRTAAHGIAALHLSADGSHAAVLSHIDANDQQVRLSGFAGDGDPESYVSQKVMWTSPSRSIVAGCQ